MASDFKRRKEAEQLIINELAALKDSPNSEKRSQLYAQWRALQVGARKPTASKPPKEKKPTTRFAKSQRERREANRQKLGPISPQAVAWSSLTAPKQERAPVERGEAMATDTTPAYPAPLSEPARPLPEPSQQETQPTNTPESTKHSKSREKAKKRRLIEEQLLKLMAQSLPKQEEEEDFEDY